MLVEKVNRPITSACVVGPIQNPGLPGIERHKFDFGGSTDVKMHTFLSYLILNNVLNLGKSSTDFGNAIN